MRIFIAGDIVPRNRTIKLFKHKNKEALFGPFLNHLKNADVSICNMECPVVKTHSSPIQKSGPALSTSRETLETIKESGFKVVTLANNHFFDMGQVGVRDTIDVCDEIGLLHVGGGINKDLARKILYIENKGEKLALINVCEHEFSIANNSHGGSNPIDMFDTFEDIKAAQSCADFVVVIVHGGVEHYQFPTPYMKRLYRHFISMGADAVINHHQHCFSGYEVYQGRPIFYGLGNFQFDSHKANVKPTSWNVGYAVELALGNETISYKLIPYVQNAEEVGFQLIKDENFMHDIDRINSVIIDDVLLDKTFEKYVLANEREILIGLLPFKSRIINALIRRGYLSFLFKNNKYSVKNMLCCESHLEKLKKIFEIYCN